MGHRIRRLGYLGVAFLASCSAPVDGPERVAVAVLDADDYCVNTSISLEVDGGSSYWMTEDHRPDRWVGEIPGTFTWRGLEGRFVAEDGTSMDYFRLAEGQFSELHCAL